MGYWKTLQEAAGPHWLRTISIVGLAAYGAASAIEAFALGHGVTFVPTLNSAYFVGGAGILLIFWWLLSYAHKLRSAAEPKIIASFETGSAGINQALVRNLPGGSEWKATFIRFRVDALSDTTTDGCSADITALAIKEPGSKEFQPIELPHSLPITPILFYVRPGIPHHIQFLSCDEKTNELKPTSNVEWPFHLEHLFKSPACFRFDISVNDGRKTKVLRIEIDWNGKWNELKGRQIPIR
jgi:hypothetical protein